MPEQQPGEEDGLGDDQGSAASGAQHSFTAFESSTPAACARAGRSEPRVLQPEPEFFSTGRSYPSQGPRSLPVAPLEAPAAGPVDPFFQQWNAVRTAVLTTARTPTPSSSPVSPRSPAASDSGEAYGSLLECAGDVEQPSFCQTEPSLLDEAAAEEPGAASSTSSSSAVAPAGAAAEASAAGAVSVSDQGSTSPPWADRTADLLRQLYGLQASQDASSASPLVAGAGAATTANLPPPLPFAAASLPRRPSIEAYEEFSLSQSSLAFSATNNTFGTFYSSSRHSSKNRCSSAELSYLPSPFVTATKLVVEDKTKRRLDDSMRSLLESLKETVKNSLAEAAADGRLQGELAKAVELELTRQQLRMSLAKAGLSGQLREELAACAETDEAANDKTLKLETPQSAQADVVDADHTTLRLQASQALSQATQEGRHASLDASSTTAEAQREEPQNQESLRLQALGSASPTKMPIEHGGGDAKAGSTAQEPAQGCSSPTEETEPSSEEVAKLFLKHHALEALGQGALDGRLRRALADYAPQQSAAPAAEAASALAEKALEEAAKEETRGKVAEDREKAAEAADGAFKKDVPVEVENQAIKGAALSKAATEALKKAAEDKARERALKEKALEEAAKEETRRKVAEEAVRLKEAEEEARKKAAEEDARKKAAEEEARKKAAEEEETRLKLEEVTRAEAAEEERRRKAAEEKAAITAHLPRFEDIDVNHDGVISREEFGNFQQALLAQQGSRQRVEPEEGEDAEQIKDSAMFPPAERLESEAEGSAAASEDESYEPDFTECGQEEKTVFSVGLAAASDAGSCDAACAANSSAQQLEVPVPADPSTGPERASVHCEADAEQVKRDDESNDALLDAMAMAEYKTRLAQRRAIRHIVRQWHNAASVSARTKPRPEEDDQASEQLQVIPAGRRSSLASVASADRRHSDALDMQSADKPDLRKASKSKALQPESLRPWDETSDNRADMLLRYLDAMGRGYGTEAVEKSLYADGIKPGRIQRPLVLPDVQPLRQFAPTPREPPRPEKQPHPPPSTDAPPPHPREALKQVYRPQARATALPSQVAAGGAAAQQHPKKTGLPAPTPAGTVAAGRRKKRVVTSASAPALPSVGGATTTATEKEKLKQRRDKQRARRDFVLKDMSDHNTGEATLDPNAAEDHQGHENVDASGAKNATGPLPPLTVAVHASSVNGPSPDAMAKASAAAALYSKSLKSAADVADKNRRLRKTSLSLPAIHVKQRSSPSPSSQQKSHPSPLGAPTSWRPLC